MSSNRFYMPLREESAANNADLKSGDIGYLNNSLGVQKLANNISDTRNQINGTMLMTPINSQNNRSRSPSPSRALLNAASAPMAHVETDEETDDREVVNRPYPGVDDGFFTNGNNEGANGNRSSPPLPQDSGNPEVEFVPTHPREPEVHDDEYPHMPGITPRLGGDGDSENPENTNGSAQPPAELPKSPPSTTNQNQNPDFPFRPFGWDLEVGSTLPSGETIPDFNVYQHKKTLAQGMMDLALFSANANQLRYVLETFRTHPYYYPSVVLISISLIMQVAVGVGLIWNATFNVRNQQDLCTANKVNNFTIIGVFLVTVINVFISSFGVAPAQN